MSINKLEEVNSMYEAKLLRMISLVAFFSYGKGAFLSMGCCVILIFG